MSLWPATWRPWPAQAGRRELVTLGQPQAEPVTLEEGFSAAPPGGGGGVPGPSGRAPAAVASLLLGRHRRRCRAGPRPWKARLGGDGHPTGTRVRCRPCHAQSTAGSAATPSPSRGAPGPRGGGAVPARWSPEGTGLEPGREAACMTRASGLRGAAETPAGIRTCITGRHFPPAASSPGCRWLAPRSPALWPLQVSLSPGAEGSQGLQGRAPCPAGRPGQRPERVCALSTDRLGVPAARGRPRPAPARLSGRPSSGLSTRAGPSSRGRAAARGWCRVSFDSVP